MVRLLGPVLVGVEALVKWLLRLIGMRVGEDQSILSPHEELRGAVDLLHREGGVEKHDRDMFGGVLDLRDLVVSDVMIHRTEMITVSADDPPEDVVNAVIASPVTRVPLWRGKPENIVGILHAKDLLRAHPGGRRRPRQGRRRRRSRGRPGSCRTSARCPSSSRRSAAARRRSRWWSTNTAR